MAWAGSIPACAGEPLIGSSNLEVDRVYPRVCGGTARRVGTIAVCDGLSPRVRGNLLTPRTWEPRLRSIPACAGEPL